jgi:hypothetical protein
MKKKSKKFGLNGTAFFSATAEWCLLKQALHGKKEIPFSFRSASLNLFYEVKVAII